MATPDPSPAPKRRRLTSALHKPFKSPFRTPLKANNANIHTTSSLNSSTIPASSNLVQSHQSAASPASSTSTIQPEYTSTPTRSQPRHIPRSLAPSAADTEITNLLSQQSALLRQLTSLRAELETNQQALKIETSTRSAELDRLIAQWRSTSRLAAEEIFGGVRDRVNRMGGVRAWRERERNRDKGGWGNGWEEPPKDGDEREEGGDEGEDGGWQRVTECRDEEGEAEREERRAAERDREGEDGREEGARKSRDDVDEDAGFTMGMMLGSLNIETGVIGWDEEMGRWID